MTWMLEELVGNRSEAMRSGVERWVKQDAGRVAAWLEPLPVSGERDVAIAVFARQVAKADPETALAWVAEIADVEQRQAIREELLQARRFWRAKDRFRRAFFFDQTLVQEHNVVRYIRSQSHVMGHDQHRAPLGGEVFDNLDHLLF